MHNPPNKNIKHLLIKHYKAALKGLLLVFWFCSIQASAQDISGYWEGILRITQHDSLTIGMMIEQQGDSLSVVMDSPDQYYMDIATTARDWHDSVLNWKVADIGASFKGKLSADGQHITGTFQQGGKLPLTFERGHERRVIRRPQTPQPLILTRKRISASERKAGGTRSSTARSHCPPARPEPLSSCCRARAGRTVTKLSLGTSPSTSSPTTSPAKGTPYSATTTIPTLYSPSPPPSISPTV